MMKNTLFCSAILTASLLNLPALAVQEVQQHNHDHDAAHQHHHDHHAGDEHQHEHDDFTQLGAHVHGVASITFILEGNEAQLALQAAAINVVGFEHKAVTTEQLQEIAAAIDIFNKAGWFSLNDDANCEITGADTSTDLTENITEGTHADFYANYQLLCQRPARLKQLQLELFNLLPALERVNVQWVINEQQGAASATLQQPVVTF
ncbi:DUF2796 domain-containing protein [Chromatiaceae bacterium AAb-1]|nr:DUF2796 domain-containing protein [Chromatiaceae bacterium AAb-1]